MLQDIVILSGSSKYQLPWHTCTYWYWLYWLLLVKDLWANTSSAPQEICVRAPRSVPKNIWIYLQNDEKLRYEKWLRHNIKLYSFCRFAYFRIIWTILDTIAAVALAMLAIVLIGLIFCRKNEWIRFFYSILGCFHMFLFVSLVGFWCFLIELYDAYITFSFAIFFSFSDWTNWFLHFFYFHQWTASIYWIVQKSFWPHIVRV